MEWQPNDQDAWRGDAERWISQIHGVKHCKIDLDRSGEITGVHVVAGMEREPRHIVRDVEGLLKARLGMSVFYKKIGVVQVVDSLDEAEAEEPEEAPAPPAAKVPPLEPFPRLHQEPEDDPGRAIVLEEAVAPRLQLAGVGVMTSPLRIRAEVELTAGGLTARGTAEGANHGDGDLGLLARATIQALSELIADPVALEVGEVRQATIGGQPVVLAVIELIQGRRSDALFGVCAIRRNRQQAVVYAVLDALNRRLAMMEFKGAGEG